MPGARQVARTATEGAGTGVHRSADGLLTGVSLRGSLPVRRGNAALRPEFQPRTATEDKGAVGIGLLHADVLSVS